MSTLPKESLDLSMLVYDEAIPGTLVPVVDTPTPSPNEQFAIRALDSRESLVGIEAPHMAILTLREADFVRTVVHQRLTAYQAAAMLNIDATELYALLGKTTVKNALRFERQEFEDCSRVTRRDVVDGLMSAIDVANAVGDAASMVAGWREIGTVTGVRAPTKVQVDTTLHGQIDVKHKLETMTDDQLRRMAAGIDTVDAEVIDE